MKNQNFFQQNYYSCLLVVVLFSLVVVMGVFCLFGGYIGFRNSQGDIQMVLTQADTVFGDEGYPITTPTAGQESGQGAAVESTSPAFKILVTATPDPFQN